MQQQYLPTLEEFVNQSEIAVVVGQIPQEHDEALKYDFMYDPTSPVAISSVVEACALLYTKSIEPFDELIKTLFNGSEKDDGKIGRLLVHMTRDGNEKSRKDWLTVTAVSSVWDDRLNALRDFEKHKNYMEYIGRVATPEYFKAEDLIDTLEHRQVPFSYFVHAFIFTQEDIAALSPVTPDPEVLKELGLAEIHEALVALRTGDDAFHYLHADRLVSKLVERFYKNFFIYYGNDYSNQELAFED